MNVISLIFPTTFAHLDYQSKYLPIYPVLYIAFQPRKSSSSSPSSRFYVADSEIHSLGTGPAATAMENPTAGPWMSMVTRSG